MPPPITNVVVLMLENRSYDNVLGKLYDGSYGSPYDEAPAGQRELWGLTGTESNVDPSTGDPISVAPATGDPNANPPLVATTIPTIDPGEPFAQMAQQIMGLTAPDTTGNPYASPPGPYGLMGGFVANYASQSRFGTPSVPAQIMMYMTPALMPVTAFLANNYAICDGWFGSVPSHTFANRLFSVCASSGSWTSPQSGSAYSYIDDLEYVGVEHGAIPVFDATNRLGLPSVFAQLDAVLGVTQTSDDAQTFPSWKLYFHDYSITAGLLEYVADQYASPAGINVGQYDTSDYTAETTHLANKSFTTFAQDLAAGTLASFTLIEPRYSNNYPGAAKGNEVQSNHPGVQADVAVPGSPQNDTYYGELLLLDVYTQLRKSTYWDTCLLLVVYDENGGCYDHLPPVTTMSPPACTTPATYTGFDFTVSGPRVPAIVVSPFASPGSTLRAGSGNVFDHTSIIKTLWDCFGLDSGKNGAPSLNDRDLNAASILDGLSPVPVNDAGIPPTPPHP